MRDCSFLKPDALTRDQPDLAPRQQRFDQRREERRIVLAVAVECRHQRRACRAHARGDGGGLAAGTRMLELTKIGKLRHQRYQFGLGAVI
jgi:hypothetical protein